MKRLLCWAFTEADWSLAHLAPHPLPSTNNVLSLGPPAPFQPSSPDDLEDPDPPLRPPLDQHRPASVRSERPPPLPLLQLATPPPPPPLPPMRLPSTHLPRLVDSRWA